MADHPLRPANRRSLGRPLPHLLADSTQADLFTHKVYSPNDAAQGNHSVLAILSDRYPQRRGTLPTRYSPVCHSPEGAFDLHVLGTPPALVLSQDRTLHQKILFDKRERFCSSLQLTLYVLDSVFILDKHTGHLHKLFILIVAIPFSKTALLRGGISQPLAHTSTFTR